MILECSHRIRNYSFCYFPLIPERIGDLPGPAQRQKSAQKTSLKIIPYLSGLWRGGVQIIVGLFFWERPASNLPLQASSSSGRACFFLLDSAVFLFDYFNVQRLIFIWGLLHTFRFQNSKPFPPTAGTFRKKAPFIRTRSLRWISALADLICTGHPKQNSIERSVLVICRC